jgi:hypothetical protein
MSHLQLPRLHFRGDFQTNVPTCNNDSIASVFPAEKFVDSALVGVDMKGMDDPTFMKWLRQIAPNFGIRAGWNLYGDGTCGFLNATVHSAQPAGANLITDPTADPIINASVDLLGAVLGSPVMVDLDPEGTLGTQIFCDQFSLVRNDLSIIGQPVRFCSRFLVERNLGAGGFTAYSATWYAAIPPGQMTISPGASPTLDSFRQAVANGAGLFVAFCTYLLDYRISDEQLAQDFALNRPTTNPAVGKLIGTLGTWDPREMATIPIGRRLNTAGTLMQDHAEYHFKPAIASVDHARKIVSLDMMHAVPELDNTLTKVNVGKLKLTLTTTTPAGTQTSDVGEVAYDRAAYELQSGVVDVPYPANLDASIDGGRLSLVQSDTGLALLDELGPTVETDDRCTYLQVNESATLGLRHLVKGQAPTAAATIRITQYVTSNRAFTPATPATAVLAVPDHVDLAADGTGEVPIKAVQPGTCVLAFLPPGEPADSRQFFCNVRVLPLDNYDAVPDSQLTFALIYKEVLRYYYLLYPAMNARINLGNEASVRIKAQFILDRTDKSTWDGSSYMPVTRDLSDGKRKLLTRWCQKVLGG